MAEEDPDLLAGENLDRLRGRNPMSEGFRLSEELENAKYQNLRGRNAMSERFRLWQELENAKYQNNLLAQKCRELERERDEARQEICIQKCDSLGAVIGGSPATPQDYAEERGWDCYNTPEAKIVKTLNGIVTDGGKAVPPKCEDLEDA